MSVDENVKSAVEQTGGGVAGLILRLRGLGMIDPDFLKSVEVVPRPQFVPVELFDHAWKPISLPIACGQSMPSPDMTVRLVEALRPMSHHSVLEIGTGSGYLTALLSGFAKKVHSIDRYKTLIGEASERLTRLGKTNVTFEQRDGQTVASDQLYDCIISDTAFETVPRHLLENLVSSGIVITAIGPALEEQMLVRLTKIGSRFEREDLFPVRFSNFETGISQYL